MGAAWLRIRRRGDNGRMSIFATKPEEPAETPGVPSEPESAETPAEHLSALTTDAASLGVFGTSSVTVPLPPPAAPSLGD